MDTTVKKEWDMYQLEMRNAFLHGDLHETITRFKDVQSKSSFRTSKIIICVTSQKSR